MAPALVEPCLAFARAGIDNRRTQNRSLPTGSLMQRLSKIGMVVAGGLLAAIMQANAADQFTLMFGQRTATASEARSYFIPKHLGFFKEENLEVTLQPTDGATQEMQLLAAGQGDAGLGAPPAILLARNSGAKVRGIYNSVSNHGTAL